MAAVLQSSARLHAVRQWLAVGLLLAAAGCTHLPATTKSPQSWPEQRDTLLTLTKFDFSGRMAVASAVGGFSGGLDWQQTDEVSKSDIRGPLGLSVARLSYDGKILRVTAGGAEVSGINAEQSLEQALGFTPPLASLAYWLRGCDDPAITAETTLGEGQRLATLRQDGWDIVYESYQLTANHWLPARLTLQREGVRVRLVLQRWTLG
jgi:outer membrane lipoprotein LolB